MTAPIQANSLAAEPPAQPQDPDQRPDEPLILYIARVPGSRDVFLTTMKPRHKVVTAEDVSSSLYYLHVNQPGDGLGFDASTDDDDELRQALDRLCREDFSEVDWEQKEGLMRN